ncbi:hypothetical protein N7533_013599 [Penicillium manginii]|uniref:uncharacterized protein n=1 Tax=Penicillium manginii TaxID=203109 RepID=UPI0025498F8B|nr:uncharacterized protein N7533_013599 [Penicillium manginii]KAJ5733152.1 hypothetical protein N7533_013599 [Penicillium manginii]
MREDPPELLAVPRTSPLSTYRTSHQGSLTPSRAHPHPSLCMSQSPTVLNDNLGLARAVVVSRE